MENAPRGGAKGYVFGFPWGSLGSLDMQDPIGVRLPVGWGWCHGLRLWLAVLLIFLIANPPFVVVLLLIATWPQPSFARLCRRNPC